MLNALLFVLSLLAATDWANAAGVAPATLEVNLGPLPVEKYNSLNTDGSNPLYPSCPATITVKACVELMIKQAASQPNNYRGQGVTGVRFFFAFGGGYYSNPFSVSADERSWQNTISSTWTANMTAFLTDLKDMGIQRVTPTPATDTWGGPAYIVPCGGYNLTDAQKAAAECTHFTEEGLRGLGNRPLKFHPWLPYGNVAGKLCTALNLHEDCGDKDGYPDGQNDNSAYYTARRNPYFDPPGSGGLPNWGGWQKFIDLMDHLFGLIQQAGLTVGDVDLMNEMHLLIFPVQARFINDPQITFVDVVKEVQVRLASRFPGDPGIKSRVIFSTFGERPDKDPPLGGYCRSPYGLVGVGQGDSAMLTPISALQEALAGNPFGIPPAPPGGQFFPQDGLQYCRWDDGTDRTGMVQAPRDPARVTEGVVNFHDKICKKKSAEIDECAPDDATVIAKEMFDETWRFLSERGITSKDIVLGETHTNQARNCDDLSPAHALWQVQGFLQSALYANHAAKTVFRPWENPARPCYKMPNPLGGVANSGPPTAVLIKAYDNGYRLAGRQDTATAGQKTFQLQYSDPDGGWAITRADVLFNEKAAELGGCSIRFFPSANQVQLMNDSGTAVVSPNGQGKLENGECIVDPAGVWKTVLGTNLTVTMPVQFKLSGPRQVWMRVSDLASYAPSTEWGARTPRPIVVSTIPASGTGSGLRTFTLTFSHPDESRAIFLADALINYDLNAINACWVRYEKSLNRIRLIRDGGPDPESEANTYVPGELTPGVAGSLSNSQCTVSTGVPGIDDSIEESQIRLSPGG